MPCDPSVSEILLMVQLAEQCAEFLSSEVMVGCLGMVPVSNAGRTCLSLVPPGARPRLTLCTNNP